MPSISEMSNAKNELNASLEQGLDDISQAQAIVFTRYERRTLPVDGFVFWVNSALLNGDSPVTQTVEGYLHLTTESIQDEAELYDRNSVIFTAKEKIDDFNLEDVDHLYIGEFYGIRFAFSRRSGYNDQAGLYHYSGNAVYPQMESQIVDREEDLDLSSAVVSNSLPIWLGLTQNIVKLYPAKLSDQNLTPPYATVKCDNPDGVAAGYMLDRNSNQYQLVAEDVTITFTGLRNAAVMDFVNVVNQYTMSKAAEMGITNIPVIRDPREPQNELNVLAMRKTVTFRVNYYENRMRDLARKLILKAIPKIYLGDKK